MLLIIAPLADILGSIGMRVGSVAVGFVVDPVTFIDVAVCVVELAAAVRFAIGPLALVATSIEPFLLSLTVTVVIQPFAFVDSS